MKCERCGMVERIHGERYCGDCREEVLQQLEDAGFLEPDDEQAEYRATSARENVRETKYGIDR